MSADGVALSMPPAGETERRKYCWGSFRYGWRKAAERTYQLSLAQTSSLNRSRCRKLSPCGAASQKMASNLCFGIRGRRPTTLNGPQLYAKATSRARSGSSTHVRKVGPGQFYATTRVTYVTSLAWKLTPRSASSFGMYHQSLQTYNPSRSSGAGQGVSFA